jgi:hypothetical protein
VYRAQWALSGCCVAYDGFGGVFVMGSFRLQREGGDISR